MPRTSGVSCTETVWCMRRSPRPRTQSRCRWSFPKGLFTSVTLIIFVFLLIGSALDLVQGLAALGGNLMRRSDAGERIHGGAHYVDGVTRAVALGEHVLHAGHFQHGAHGAAGDDAGTVRGGLHEHPGGAVAGAHRVIQRAVLELDLLQVLAGLLHGLGDGVRDLAGLAVAEPDLAVAIADHGERGEAEQPAALDHLGHAVHGDQLFLQAVVAFRKVIEFSHVSPLELETVLTRGVGQSLHPPVIAETRAVERDRRDAGLLRLVGDGLADGLGRGDIPGILEALLDLGFQRGRGHDHLVALGGDDLRVDMARRAVHGEPESAQFVYAGTGATRTTQARQFLFHRFLVHRSYLLLLLGFLELYPFVRVAHALALVGFGGTEAANL